MEVDRIMKIAMYGLVAMVGLMGLTPAVTSAAIPDGKVAVVRITAVAGLAHTPITSTSRTSVFAFDGTEYHIDQSALGSLDGVKTLVLIDRATDDASGTRDYSQEVRAYNRTAFESTDLKGKVLSYQVAMIGGNFRLLGDGDQILAMGGADGPYQVWKITGIDLVDKKAIVLE
jgi:hypothetical protein